MVMNVPSQSRKGILLLVSAVFIQLCLGASYGWSLYVKPFMAQHGWSQAQVTLAFSLCFSFNGIAYFFAGFWADARPRKMVLVGGLLLGLGVVFAGLGSHYGWLVPLYIGYGIIGGLAGGMCYLACLSSAIKWFPEHRGLVSGIVVMGSGAGAVLVGLIVPNLIVQFGPGLAFMTMGLAYLVICLTFGWSVRNPPDYICPISAGHRPVLIPWDILRQKKFWSLWAMLFASVFAGIGILSQAAPMAQELHKLSLEQAGRLVAMMAVGNGLGRIFWSSLSDRIGRSRTIFILFSSLVAVFLVAFNIPNVWVFQAAFCYITFCYGGGFGTMPAFTADLFGTEKVGRIYGPVMSAQSAAGLTSPLMFAFFRQQTGSYTLPVYITAGLLLAACILPLWVGRRLAAASTLEPTPVMPRA